MQNFKLKQYQCKQNGWLVGQLGYFQIDHHWIFSAFHVSAFVGKLTVNMYYHYNRNEYHNFLLST